MVAYGSATALLGEKACVVIEASNVGDGKTTITHVVSFFYDSWLKRALRRRPTKTFMVSNPLPGRLPHVLDKGERWLGMMEQNEDLIKMSQDGYLYCGIFHSTAKRPVTVRLIIRE